MFFHSQLNHMYIFFWKDFVEIGLFALVLYSFSLWLKQDNKKNLLTQFYSLLTIFTLTYIAGMESFSSFLYASWPALTMLFILVHQNTLQKNFIALKNITPSKIQQDNWIEVLIRSCIVSMNRSREIICIIEGKDSLSEFVKSSLFIQADLNKGLLDALFDSQCFDNKKMLWVSDSGKLVAINAEWNIKNHVFWVSDELQELNDWKHDAILFTSRTDSIVFKVKPEKHTFDIVAQGKILEDLHSNNAHSIIQQFIRKNSSNNLKGAKTYENNLKNSSKQPHA